MVEIPGGSFEMGANLAEIEQRENELPRHEVNLQPFFLGKFPVTQAQWRIVMPELPFMHKEFLGDDLPVVNVYLEKALEFCARISRITNQNFYLPSEAQWEYACRGNTKTPFHFGQTMTTDLANFDGTQFYNNEKLGEFRGKTTPAGYFEAANPFGLYDLHGNVWEWCADVWHADYNGAPTDGSAWTVGGDQSYCVQRGGSWRDRAGACRSAFRVGDIARNFDHIVGLRVCLKL